MAEPKEGETWHMIFPGSVEITTRQIKELTENTVYFTNGWNYHQRFRRSDVQFIEIAKPAEQVKP